MVRAFFMRCEQVRAVIVKHVVVLNLFWLCQPSAPGPLHKVTLIPHVTLNLFQGPFSLSSSGLAAR